MLSLFFLLLAALCGGLAVYLWTAAYSLPGCAAAIVLFFFAAVLCLLAWIQRPTPPGYNPFR